MSISIRGLALIALVVIACASEVCAGEALPYKLARVWPNLTFTHPVCLAWPDAPDPDARLYLVEQAGRIMSFPSKGAAPATAVLDIHDAVNSRGSEEGMLAIAFHPSFARDRRIFVWYCVDKPRRNRLSSFTVDAKDAGRFDPASEQVLIDVDDPYENHNGGTLLFGVDHMLYLSIGDGGSGGDPHGNGQKRDTLLGKVLRIDVDHQDAGLKYAVPKDNPFAGIAGIRGEIWAYGCRNMWRMSFDRQTHELWAGDVGQNSFEEIDLIVKGGNYGWNIREGTHPFKDPGDGQDRKLIEPVIDYPASLGKSVTGGYVYRGKRFPELVGTYIYADFVSGRVWGLTLKDGKVAGNREIASQGGISSFAEDRDGELYALAYGNGTIVRFEKL